MKTTGNTLTLRRYHPETGEDAEELPAGLPVEAKEEIAAMRRNGAKFYFEEFDDGWYRVELSNVSFVAHALGQTLNIITEK